MNYFKFHIGDYASATRHLSWDEDMAYRRLLDAYYMREAPLPLDMKQVYRLTMAVSKPQRQAIDAVLAEFFTKTEDGYTNARCEEELASFVSKRDSAKASAKKRWEDSGGNANASPDAHANASNPQSQCSAKAMLPLTTNQEKEESKKENLSSAALLPRDRFEEVDAALRKVPGIEKHPVSVAPVIAPIWKLVEQGYDLQRQIIPSIRKRLQSANGSKPISSWGYFVQGIIEDNAAAAGSSMALIDDAKWAERIAVARRKRQWDPKWDAMPGQPGCRVPQHLLASGDGEGWTEWKPDRSAA